jgi:quercetin dioxygenase-like cupin family protein
LKVKGKRLNMIQEKYNEATQNRPEGDRTMDADLVKIDIPDFIRKIKSEDAWIKNDRNSMSVFKTNDATIVIMALRKGAELKEHRDRGIVTMQVIEGSVDFCCEGKEVELKAGETGVVHKEIKHWLKAKEDSVVLMTSTGS